MLLNITGGADDDLLIDGQSITDELTIDGLYPDPGPHGPAGLVAPAGEVHAHEIGTRPGPFQDAVNGGITIPWNKRRFTVACRDTVGGWAGLDVTLRVISYQDHDWLATITATDRLGFFVVQDSDPLYLVGTGNPSRCSGQEGHDGARGLTAGRLGLSCSSRNSGSGHGQPLAARREARMLR